ncbi:class I SAM-dependent methyltransferase [Pseudomonas parafulva]|uniref:Class I SAM-dependent methyltransferase n=1 Tax=Pseudomonas parafulva TaxID=157782 RepID=A0AAI8KAB2_9PSED|nr:class I SAM-dependent methyltransferase [Pseudomonas parafulva]AIZ33481.1 methyltransferase [Pseudomonas parafulva]AXO89149.1 class I SAM-dependent methyltransferase [Pseudomonas parafulva]
MFELLDSKRYPAHYQTLETQRVKRLLGEWSANRRQSLSVLDYGLGRGKYLRLFREWGLQPVGVDINPDYINQAIEEGFEAYHESELAPLQQSFDVIFLSHLVEHLDPTQLLTLLKRLIDLLAPGGRLVLISPVLGERFFHDFSHVRPYYPQSIRHAFGQSNAPLSFGASERIVLSDIYFFRDPYRTRLWRSFYVEKSVLHPFTRWINRGLDLAWRASNGHVGVTSSWLGVYQQC